MSKATYEDLIVWQRAIDLVPKVYAFVRCFPQVETYALSDQLRRAVVSVPANIAEGQARQHPKEFVQHLMIAKGSLAELHTLLIVAQRLGYVTAEQLGELEDLMAGIRAPLSGLISKIRPAR